MNHEQSPFADRGPVASYADNARRNVPGLTDLHRMTTLLLAEPAPGPAHILVVGAGGGMEIKAMAEARPDWRFTGFDPSSAMLDAAREVLEPVADRIDLIDGKVDEAPDGPFDGAPCLLTLHHLGHGERLSTLQGIRRRLKTDANLVIAQHTASGPDPERWITRSVTFSGRNGLDLGKDAATGREMVERLTLLSPAEEEDLLREAGFDTVALFYAALSFRGWVASASGA